MKTYVLTIEYNEETEEIEYISEEIRVHLRRELRVLIILFTQTSVC